MPHLTGDVGFHGRQTILQHVFFTMHCLSIEIRNRKIRFQLVLVCLSEAHYLEITTKTFLKYLSLFPILSSFLYIDNVHCCSSGPVQFSALI